MGNSTLLLACDVGGTNTSVALVRNEGRRFLILRRFRFSTQELASLEEALFHVRDELDEDGRRDLLPRALCISGAGPVRRNTCHLTNVPWTIEGDSIAEALALPVRVINDFTAISYGIPLLDTEDTTKLGMLAPAATPPPEPEGTVRAVVGAGTGLGVGYVIDHHREYLALPSEGGHAPFAPYDERSRNLLASISRRESASPGAESFVSGRGIGNILEFFRETGRIGRESTLLRDIKPDSDTARTVSDAAHAGDPLAVEIMEFFVENYARVAAGVALHFLPLGGLYLAGGIVTKNEHWFTAKERFLKAFRISYRPNIQTLLQRIPVYVVRDYEVSLYGAAYGALLLLKEKTA
ncbi:MAG: glucokinase [Spirochaetaceae bacterium]|nr:MAG: glucokinase [Spirochaetaceae bacterium]